MDTGLGRMLQAVGLGGYDVVHCGYSGHQSRVGDTEENVPEATWSSLRAFHAPQAKLINPGGEKDRQSQGSR